MSLLKNTIRSIGRARHLSTSQVSKSAAHKFSPIDPTFKAKQKLLQADNDLPVHLKGGVSDMLMMRLTGVGCAIGFVWSMTLVIKEAFKEFH